jgi:hypothetical protein
MLVAALLSSLVWRTVSHSTSVPLIATAASLSCLLLLVEVQLMLYLRHSPQPPLMSDDGEVYVWLLLVHTTAQALNGWLLRLYLLALLASLAYDCGVELSTVGDAAKIIIGS